jgi:hypothetical protein
MNAKIKVYFTCPCCELVYQTSQVRTSERLSGRIACVKCCMTVHSWTGSYDFVAWKPLTRHRQTPPRIDESTMKSVLSKLRDMQERETNDIPPRKPSPMTEELERAIRE